MNRKGPSIEPREAEGSKDPVVIWFVRNLKLFMTTTRYQISRIVAGQQKFSALELFQGAGVVHYFCVAARDFNLLVVNDRLVIPCSSREQKWVIIVRHSDLSGLPSLVMFQAQTSGTRRFKNPAFFFDMRSPLYIPQQRCSILPIW